jgi:hypothetical protein
MPNSDPHPNPTLIPIPNPMSNYDILNPNSDPIPNSIPNPNSK